MNIKIFSLFIVCILLSGCQALIKNEPELMKIEQDIIDEALRDYPKSIA